MNNFLGIDQSLTAPGYSWARLGAESTDMEKLKIKGDARLARIYQDVLDMVEYYLSWTVCIEAVPPYQKGSQSLAMVQGVVRAALSRENVTVYTVAPSSLKKAATGLGKASKQDMFDALPYDVQEQALEDSWDDNAVDAWWLRQVAIGIDRDVVSTHLKEMPKFDKLK